MKRRLHFYRWLLCLLLFIGGSTLAYSKTNVTSLDQLKAGSIIKIYPYGKVTYSSLSLACSGKEMSLTSYAYAEDGDMWTLVDAGSGYYYLKNNLGCYWAYQNNRTGQSLACTTDISSAVRVKLTWDSKYGGVCFWNEQDGKGLKNLDSYYNCLYNWYSSPSDYNSDTNTTFDVVIYEELLYVENGVRYRLDLVNKTATVVNNNYSGDIVIPQTVSYFDDVYPVTAVADKCFQDCSTLTSVTLPNGITSLGNSCFSGCSSLTNITLPEGITSLPDKCFYGCSRLTSITLPDGITSLKNWCFSGCSSLANIALPESITSLGEYCFARCFNLANITLPGNITSLRSRCFYCCSSLTNINLPEGITSLGGNCFEDCSSLTKITLPESITSLGWGCFTGCSSLTNINLPKGITSLPGHCFSGCSSLANIALPEGITSLDIYCFYGCSSLTNIILPEGITSLPDRCFDGCSRLTSITLPDGITSLGTYCFSGCSSLTNITLPDGITSLGMYCFNGCRSLTNITLPSGITSLPDWCFSSCRSLTNMTLPEGITSLGTYCFFWCIRLTNMTLPEGITSLGEKCFYACSRLNSIILPSTLQSIGNYALDPVKQIVCQATVPPSCGTNCIDSACVLYIPKGTLDIYKNTSPWNEAGTILEGIPISSLSLPNEFTLVKTESKALDYTVYPKYADNQTFDWSSDNPEVATVNNGLIKGVGMGVANIIAKTTDGSNLSDTCRVTVIPETVTLSPNSINLQTGDKYEELTVTVLPDNFDHKNLVWTTSGNGVANVDVNGNITAIKPGIDTIRCALNYDKDVYSECQVIVYDENVVYVGGLYYTLNDKDTNDRWATVTSIYGGKNTSLDAKNVAQYYFGTINIPETIIYGGNKYTVRKVGSYAFNCQNELQGIYIPRTVTEVEHHAAIKAENLNHVNVADESVLETIGNSAFYGCTALEKVLWIGKSELKTIQDYAFFKCIALNNFDMPNTTLSVGNSSFRYNASLTDIHLSTSLNYIDEYAFGECGFSHITLPESLVNIQAGAFINNEHLQEITLPERLQGLGSAAFENNSKLESVTFHTAIETMTIGNNAFNQCPILNKVYISNLKSFAQTYFYNDKANPANTSQHIYDANGNEIINVVLPKGTKYVNNNAFNGCAYIESIEMPATMDHINDDIFVGCSALKDVYCYAEEVPEFIGINDPSAMSDVFAQATLHVVYGKESAYKADSWWGRFYQVEGCDNPYKEDVKATSISIGQEDVTLKPDDTVQLEATVYPTNATNKNVLWSSSDEAVAMVTDEGFVRAVAEGEADITAEAADGSGIKAVCHVKVEKAVVPIVQIRFEESPVTIAMGETKTLKVIFNPENATNKQLTWTSVKPSVVEVDQEGNILGVSEGKSIVSAKTTDGSNLTINCIVTVTKTTSIGYVTVGDVKLVVNKRCLKVEGLADGDVIKVVNILGFTVYEGTEHEVGLNAAGIYIVKAKGKEIKVAVK